MEATQPDFTITRKDRIYRLNKQLDRARYQDDVAAVRRLEKEIEIQRCYIQLEEMSK